MSFPRRSLRLPRPNRLAPGARAALIPWLAGARLTLLLTGALPLLALAAPARGQTVIVHNSGSLYTNSAAEDGDPKLDGDGMKNGVVVWNGGTVHVTGRYSVERDITLKIQPGAIVKFASQFRTTADGRLEAWAPTFDGGIISNGGVIQIERATLTDIRDDSVGGDTNGDGSRSSPPTSAANVYALRLSGTAQDILQGNTVKYCSKLGRLGSLTITDNRFVMFGGMRADDGLPFPTSPTVINAAPVITKNTFELVSGSLDLRGMSPLVQDNVIRGGGGITIGPGYEYGFPGGIAGPTAGTTRVVNNQLEGGGIRTVTTQTDTLYAQVRFRAEIQGNTIRGLSPMYSVGLDLVLDAQANVSANVVSNCLAPLRLLANDKTETSRLDIRGNQFAPDGVFDRGPGALVLLVVPERLWKKGHVVQAAGNFWGDPTGPLDPSNADGLQNPEGKGMRVGDGIQYLPFIGGSPPPIRDLVQITVSPNSPPPFIPNTTVSFAVAANYQRRSARTGRIVLLVRDPDGLILNQPETSLRVTADGRAATLPAVQVKVPEYHDSLTVEAVLAPDGEGESSRSNVESFRVGRPPSRFSIDLTDATGGALRLVRGTRARVKARLTYTLTTAAAGRFEINLQERARQTGQVLRDFPLLTLPATTGANLVLESGVVEFDVPMRDVLKQPAGELVAQVTFIDGQGMVVGKQVRVIPIDDSPDRVRIQQLFPGAVVGGQFAPRPHLVVGQVPIYAASTLYTIETPNVTNWQVWVGDDEALDANGVVLQQFKADQPAQAVAATGPERAVERRVIIGKTPLPAGTRTLRVYARLVGLASNLTVAVATWDVPVRDAP